VNVAEVSKPNSVTGCAAGHPAQTRVLSERRPVSATAADAERDVRAHGIS
jgi:hypothetical protein